MTTLAQLREVPYPPTWAAPRTEAERLTQEGVMLMQRYWLLLVAVAEAAEAVDQSHEENLPATVGEAEILHNALAALRARLENQ